MKLLYTLVGILILFTIYLNGQISGIKSIGEGGDYESLSEAVDDVNSLGLNGNTVLEVMDGYDTTEYIHIKSYTGNDMYTLTIRPEEGATGIHLNSNSALLIYLDSTNHVIIDGRPGGVADTSVFNLTQNHKGNSTTIYAEKCKNTIIRYCSIKYDGSRAINFSYSDSSIADHCDIATNSTGPETNGATVGIQITRSTNSVVKNNKVHNLHVLSVPVITGIEFYNPDPGSSIDSIYNNFVALNTERTDSSARITGIYHYDNENSITCIYHNTIFIGGDGIITLESYNIHEYAYGELNIKNNILINQRSNGLGTQGHYGINIDEEGTPVIKSDYNLIYCNGTGGIAGYYIGDTDTTLTQWQTHTGWDTNSVSKSVEFEDIVSGDLHLAGNSLTDTELYGIFYSNLPDIDGEQRWADSTFMGADQPSQPEAEPEPEPESLKQLTDQKAESFEIFHSGDQIILHLQLEKTDLVNIDIYDITGRHIYTVVHKKLYPGEYTFVWNGESENSNKSATGIYIVQFRNGNLSECKKILY